MTNPTPIPIVSVTNEETSLAYSEPAPLVNKVYVHLSGFTGRIAFAEVVPIENAEVFIRSAVSMSIPDLQSLATIILDLIQKHGVMVEMTREEKNPNG